MDNTLLLTYNKLTDIERESFAREHIITAKKVAKQKSSKFKVYFDDMFESCLEGLARALYDWDRTKSRNMEITPFIIMYMNTYCLNTVKKHYRELRVIEKLQQKYMEGYSYEQERISQ